MKLYFVGMPGVGKSTIGKKVARELKLDFFDLDKYIEKKEEKSVSEIFAEKGESYFRDLETKYLKEFAEKKGAFVLSCGGGTPCFNDNMETMKKSGIVSYLTMPNAAILSRITQSNNKRPMFENKSEEEAKEIIEKIFEERRAFYEQAQVEYEVLNFNIEKYFDKLFEVLK
jgi:shikimate kinase